MFGIDDAITAISNLADSAIKRIFPDATEVEKAKLQQYTQELQNAFSIQMAQLDINKFEAQSASVFVAGWRPFIGWTCGLSFAYAGLIEPFARFLAVVAFGYTGVFPVIDTDLTTQVLTGLLGITVASLRSYEKAKKLTK